MTKISKRSTNARSAATSGTKPPYQIPTLKEVEELPKNGYRVISTFTGCGGSCLGFKIAGFTPIWANEFIPAARDTYRANFPSVTVDERDIRKIEPSDILAATGLRVGEADVLEGSPPCASFSMAGKRNKHWGDIKAYSDTKQRTDDLFWEYARLVNSLQPKVFVAENVSGLVKGKARGYFKEILKLLKECGYNVGAQVLDAQWLGVPQARQRIIFIGVRNDLDIRPAFPKPLRYRYSLREALPTLSRVSGRTGPSFQRVDSELDEPMNSILPSDIEQTRYEVVGVKTYTSDHSLDEVAPTVLSHGRRLTRNELSIVEREVDISGYAIGREWDKLKPGETSDRYFNLSRPSLEKPCPTVTQRGGSVDAASVTHPIQRRKFTIDELKLICSFPEDFKLTGTYSQQWERLGRSVPPLMMKAIAEVVRDEVLAKCVTR